MNDHSRYVELSRRLTPAANLTALLVVLMTEAWLWGQWRAFAIAFVGQAIMFAVNAAISGWLIPRLGAHAELWRALFNTLGAAAMYHEIGWPLPVWFWPVFSALALDELGGRDTLAILILSCGLQDAFGLLDGVSPQIVAVFTGFAVIARVLVGKRVQIIRDMQHELRQAQKLEALGRLAAGVAHEINTPMQFIGDNLAFVREGVSELLANGPEVDREFLASNLPDALAMANEGVQRVATIVRSMKQFAHPARDGIAPVDLARAVQDTLTLARHEYKLVADVETELGELPAVPCHGGELGQVLLNLVINAAHAIEERVAGTDQRGRITVRTYREDDAAVIEIGDTGTGIPAELQSKIFEPFFTTKPVGRGTGQGLALARAFVERHGGRIGFASEVGRGTTFSVHLPYERVTALAA